MRAPNVSRPIAEWRDPRHRRGIAGEMAAARYLESRGFVIEAHRFRLGHHDVDLIARRDSLVAFVEVKARLSTRFGSGAESIGWRKRRALAQVASIWVARHGRAGDRYRFDLVAVSWPGSGFPQVEHIEGAWSGVGK
jgi:putative endonuclease